jgi:hypothetical protein
MHIKFSGKFKGRNLSMDVMVILKPILREDRVQTGLAGTRQSSSVNMVIKLQVP